MPSEDKLGSSDSGSPGHDNASSATGKGAVLLCDVEYLSIKNGCRTHE